MDDLNTVFEHPEWCALDHEVGELHRSEWDGWADYEECGGHVLARDVGSGSAAELVEVAVHAEADGAEAVLRVPVGRAREMLEEVARALGYPLDEMS